MKRCASCGEEKSESEFHRRGHRWKSSCKVCRSRANAEPSAIAQRQAYQASYSARADIKTRRVEYYLKWKYDLSPEQFAVLLSEQQGACKICKHIPNGKGREGKLHVDHCHTTGKIRGLLCMHCNTGLGKFRESATLLSAAINYLSSATHA